MFNSWSKVGVADIAFYVPAVLCAAYHLIFRHGRPRLGWYYVFIFTLFRLASGIVLILHENYPKDVGLLAASIALLSAGTVPLVVSSIGFLRIVIYYDYQENKIVKVSNISIRVLFLIGVLLLAGGGGLLGDYKHPNIAEIGLSLIKAGYVAVLITFVTLIVYQGCLCRRWRTLSTPSKRVLFALRITVPFITIRLTNAFLSVFSGELKWSPIYGSVGIFVGMVLVMEYIVVCIYLVLGFFIPSTKKGKAYSDIDKGKSESFEAKAITDDTSV